MDHRWPYIVAVANALLERETLTGIEIREVIDGVPQEELHRHFNEMAVKANVESAVPLTDMEPEENRN
jgi:hypothetical protein